MNKYHVEVHGFGDGYVWAKTRSQAHYLVIQHLRRDCAVPFTQPMNLCKLHIASGQNIPGSAGVSKWREWQEEEFETV